MDQRPNYCLPDDVVAHLPAGHGFDCDRDAAVGTRAVRQRVRAPQADPVNVDPDTDVLAGHVACPGLPRADDHGCRVGRLRIDVHDPPTQLGAGPQRVEQVEVVGRDERSDGAVGNASYAPHQRLRGDVERSCAHDFSVTALKG